MKILPAKWRRTLINRYILFVEKSKHTSIPGFDNIPIYDVVTFFRQEIKRDQLPVRASAISFNFLLAIFPSIIFLFTLIPYIPIGGLDVIIHKFFKDVLPYMVWSLLKVRMSILTPLVEK